MTRSWIVRWATMSTCRFCHTLLIGNKAECNTCGNLLQNGYIPCIDCHKILAHPNKKICKVCANIPLCVVCKCIVAKGVRTCSKCYKEYFERILRQEFKKQVNRFPAEGINDDELYNIWREITK